MSSLEAPTTVNELTNAEVIHYPGCDIVINRDSERVGWAHKLAELFQKDNIPSGWKDIGPEIDEEDLDDEDLDNRGVGVPKYGMAVGEVDGVQFLVKPKAWTGPYHQELLLNTNSGDRWFTRRMNSVMNEVRLAPKIKNIVASPEMQSIVQKYGYASVKYVEPVIAVLRHDTKRKYLVYEYIPHVSDIWTHYKNNGDFELIDTFESDIKNLFKTHGIDAREGELQHLLVDDHKALHLIDIEAFGRIPATSPN